MAKNLRTKIPESDEMVIHDLNPKTTEQFAQEVGNVTVAKNVREVAENTVSVNGPPRSDTRHPRLPL